MDAMNALEPSMQRLTDTELRHKTVEFMQRLAGGENLDELLVDTYAVVREAALRVLGMRPFDVQLLGAILLHRGQIAEMRTGEGKSLVAVLPAYLNALTGQGVHVVTVNDYLARRDSEGVGQILRFLGLEVGLVQEGMDESQRRTAYAADVTYVTHAQLGFDYLRDNLAHQRESLVLRPFRYCIVDEADSILIDEARTPLVISGPGSVAGDKYRVAARLVARLDRGQHYAVDEKRRGVHLTEEGYEAAEEALGVTDLHDPRAHWSSYLLDALRARELYRRDTAYIVRDGRVVIVDEFTGRAQAGRRWSDGLHQAVEAKEGLDIQPESTPLASITYQSFFRAFPKLAGMTGTAATEAAELRAIYGLAVAPVPGNRPHARVDGPDVVFGMESAKWKAVAREVLRMHRRGRPVLVGVTSVRASERLAQQLVELDIGFRLLNARPENVEWEAEIVAQSGRRGAVTIATNMAGRGTDILLGGNAEYMARLKLREVVMPAVEKQGGADGTTSVAVLQARCWGVTPGLYPCELSSSTRAAVDRAVASAVEAWGPNQLEALETESRLAFACERAPTTDPVLHLLRCAFLAIKAEFKAVTDVERTRVVALGGLHVIGTERHESRRIDNQLRGRSGRQGDPGTTQFFLSLEDNIFRVFGGDRIQTLMSALHIGDLPIESKMLTGALDGAQRKVEAYYFDARKQLFDYDQVLDIQRGRVYEERRRALLAPNLTPVMLDYARKTVDDILEANVDPKTSVDSWPIEALASKMVQYCPIIADFSPECLWQAARTKGYAGLRALLWRRGEAAYHAQRSRVSALEPGLMLQAERYFLLLQIDTLWQEHLQVMKFLQQAVSLRGYAQHDPLVEYKLEAYHLYVELMAQLRRNVIYNIYMFTPKLEDVSVAHPTSLACEDMPLATQLIDPPAGAGAGAGR